VYITCKLQTNIKTDDYNKSVVATVIIDMQIKNKSSTCELREELWDFHQRSEAWGVLGEVFSYGIVCSRRGISAMSSPEILDNSVSYAPGYPGVWDWRA